MQIFDDFQSALEEAKYCAEEERNKYYVFKRGGQYVVRKKYDSIRLKKPHIEVGFKWVKQGRPVDVE